MLGRQCGPGTAASCSGRAERSTHSVAPQQIPSPALTPAAGRLASHLLASTSRAAPRLQRCSSQPSRHPHHQQPQRCRGQRAGVRAHSSLTSPSSALDVDAELWEVLDMCSDEELEAVYNVLHASSPFSPIIKSLVVEKEPALISQRGRASVMHKVEARFRFLAADSAALLAGRRPGYRTALLNIRDRLDVPCSSNLVTNDLETELFLHILHHCVEYVAAEHDPDPSQAEAVALVVQHSDGMTASSSGRQRRTNWTERLTAPILFGVKELVPLLAKGALVTSVTALGRRTAQTLATQLLCSHVRYQAAVKAAATAATAARGAVAGWGKQALLEAAQRGVTLATARYSAVQGALALAGPLMWGWLAVDLALKAIGCDYARVVRAVFLLAQVRLLKTNGFVSPAMLAPPRQQ